MNNINRWLNPLCVGVALVLLMSACANRYGAKLHNTFVDISTEPKSSAYYLLSDAEAQKILGEAASGAIGPVRAQLNDKTAFRGDDDQLLYRAGTFVAVVDCGSFWRKFKVRFSRGIVNRHTLTCGKVAS